jgi:sporulation protein YlmC with PRC-barrel domain
MRRSAMLVASLAFVAQARAEGFYAHLFEPGTLRVDEVIGMEVITPEGKTLGRIHDVLFDQASGSIDSIALDGAGERYPVSSLISSDTPGKIIVEPPLDLSSAGGTALLAAPARLLSGASGKALLIDLRDGRVRPTQ